MLTEESSVLGWKCACLPRPLFFFFFFSPLIWAEFDLGLAGIDALGPAEGGV